MANRAEGDVDKRVYSRFFGDGRPGRVFVDVGAARPDYLSISAHFREHGWRIIAVEPIPEFAELQRAVGHEVYECACGPDEGRKVEFSVVNSHGSAYEGGAVSYESFSSLSFKEGYAKLLPPEHAVHRIEVTMRRLDSVLEDAGVQTVDILSIDVEGWEMEVLEGLDFERYQPRVMVIENFLNDPSYVTRVEARGYTLWETLTPNEVYVHPEMTRSLPLPARLQLWAKAKSRAARGQLRQIRSRMKTA